MSSTSEAVSAAKLAAYLRQFVPSYMVPWSFDWIAALPRTNTGKIDYQVLKKLAAENDHAEHT